MFHKLYHQKELAIGIVEGERKRAAKVAGSSKEKGGDMFEE